MSNKRLQKSISLSDKHKKPKLDIVFKKPVSRHSLNRAEAAPTFPAPGPSKPTEDLWGDEDDDDVLFQTTQMVEQKVETESAQLQANTLNVSLLSISQFRREAAHCSTQLPPPPVQPPIVSLLDDDDDDDWPLITNGDVVAARLPSPKPSTSTSNGNRQRDKILEAEKFCMNSRIEGLTSDVQLLTTDVAEYKNQLQSKDMEVTALQEELRRVKKQMDELHRDKIMSTGNIVDQWQKKTSDIYQQLQSKDTELKMKNIEISQLKRKNEINLNESMAAGSSTTIMTKSFVNHSKDCFDLQLLSSYTEEFSVEIPVEIFEDVAKRKMSHFEDEIEPEVTKMRNILSRTKIEGLVQRERFCSECVASLKKVVVVYSNYFKIITGKTSISVKSTTIVVDENSSIFQGASMYPEERLVAFRRYIAILSIICRQIPEICECFFSEKLNDKLILDEITDSINKLNCSSHGAMYANIQEAFAYLLSALCQHSKGHSDQITLFLKALVFSRPNTRTLTKISESLFNLSMHSSEYSQYKLCVQSPSDNFRFNTRQKTYDFTADTCVLQVFSCLLQNAFPPNRDLSPADRSQLTSILLTQSKFLSRNFNMKTKPQWMQNFLECNDSESFSSSARFRPQKYCSCYVRTCKSFLTNLYLFAQEWERNRNFQDSDRVRTIANVGAKAVYQIFYFSPIAYEHSINHKIFVICQIFSKHHELLELAPALKLLIDKSILSNDTKDTKSYDFRDWAGKELNEDDFFK